MEDSIEEDIKILENMNDGYTFKDCDICNNYNEKTKCCDKHKCMELQAIEHILRDYKRVSKENEILKEEKEQAWEEWNNLERGSYETKQKLKQQIKELQKENEEWDRKFCDLQNLYFKLQDESELKRKEYQETYKDVREELKELKKENEELKERNEITYQNQ